MSLAKAIKQNLELLLTINDNFRKDIVLSLKNLLPQREKTIYYNLEEEGKYYKALYKQVIKIRKKYNLSAIYQDGLITYLYENKIYPLDREIGWKYRPIEIKNPHNKKEKIIAIPLYPESNITDIKKYWKDISKTKNRFYSELKKTKNQKIVTRKNHKRDLEIYKLKKSGLKAIEVKNIINEKYPNSKIGYEEVSKLIKRLNILVEQIIGGK